VYYAVAVTIQCIAVAVIIVAIVSYSIRTAVGYDVAKDRTGIAGHCDALIGGVVYITIPYSAGIAF